MQKQLNSCARAALVEVFQSPRRSLLGKRQTVLGSHPTRPSILVHVMLLFFQDLAFHGSPDRRASLREALIQRAHAPWRHASQREAEMRGHFGGEDVILFEHEATNQLPAAGLTLWQRSDGYEVTNIVPLNAGNILQALFGL